MRNLGIISVRTGLLVWILMLGGLAVAAPIAKDYATAQQRAALLDLRRTLCNSAQGTAEAPGLEVQMVTRALADAKSAASIVDISSNALGMALNKLGEGDAAESWQMLCVILAAQARVLGPAAPRTIATFNNFAYALRKGGHVAQARQILQLIEPIVRRYPPAGEEFARRVLSNLGTTLVVQGYYDEGVATLRRSLSYEQGNPSATTLTNIARALELQSRWGEAEQLHADLLPRRHGLERAATLNNLGVNLTAQGRLRDGETRIREALAIRKETLPDGHLNIGYSLAGLVENLLRQGKSGEALPYAQELLVLRRQALGEVHSETAEAYRLMAQIQGAAGRRQEALEAARAALESSRSLAVRETEGLDDDAKIGGRRETAVAALEVVTAAWELRDAPAIHEVALAPDLLQEAFLAAQRISTSSTLEAQLSAGARAAAAAKGSRGLAEQFESELVARAELDNSLARSAANGHALQSLQDKMVQLDQRHMQTTERLRNVFPAYFDLIQPEPVALDVVAGALQDNEVLFLITPGNEMRRGFVWVVTHDRVAWAQVAIAPDELRKAVSEYRRVLDPGNSGVDRAADSSGGGWQAGYELYRAMFGDPLVRQVAQGRSNWILAPQGALMSLPFNALLLTPPDAGLAAFPPSDKLRAMRWMGLETTLSLLPSVGSLRVLRNGKREPEAGQPFFGLGDPYFPDSRSGRLREVRQKVGVTSSDLDTLRQLDSLPGTRVEIEQLARLLKAGRTSILLGPAANEKNFWRRQATGQLANARIVAFATHGLMGGELSKAVREPALVLTPPRALSADDDGLLTASEIARLQLRADWVLLSACNSSAGRTVQAEGLTGLARSFLYAGARSLLISHWRVSDAVAPLISGRIMELTQMTKSVRTTGKASAVRQAMAEVMRNTAEDEDDLRTYAHPRAWAVFAFIGVD